MSYNDRNKLKIYAVEETNNIWLRHWLSSTRIKVKVLMIKLFHILLWVTITMKSNLVEHRPCLHLRNTLILHVVKTNFNFLRHHPNDKVECNTMRLNSV